MRKLLNFSALVLILIAVIACSKSKDKKEVDAADPILTITAPANDFQFIKGGNNYMRFSATASDDLALSKLVVSLAWVGVTKSSEFDSNGTVTSTFDPWAPAAQTFNLTGKNWTFTNEQLFGSPIPDNIKSGFYRITFQLTDAADKSVSVERVVEVL